jgi:hypothetical protein
MMVLTDRFGVDWFGWEPETLKEEIRLTFDTQVSPHNWEKIQAVRTLTATVGFWKEWEIFEKIIQALNNNVARFDIVQKCTMSQLMAGVDIANTIREEEFGEEIEKYITACAIDEGVTYLPSPLDFAQRSVSAPHYRCKTCGQIGLDDSDGRCDFCVGRFSGDHPLNWKASPVVRGNVGNNLERYLLRDPETVRLRFDILRAKNDVDTLSDESAEDVQAAKLVVACQYMELRREQLVEQLKDLKPWIIN